MAKSISSLKAQSNIIQNQIESVHTIVRIPVYSWLRQTWNYIAKLTSNDASCCGPQGGVVIAAPSRVSKQRGADL